MKVKAHRYKPFHSPDAARSLGWYHGYTGERKIYANDYYIDGWNQGREEMRKAFIESVKEIKKDL